MKYKYKGDVYSDDSNDLGLLLAMVAIKEKEVESWYKGIDFYVNGEYIGNDSEDDLEDIIDKLIENGIDIEMVGDVIIENKEE